MTPQFKYTKKLTAPVGATYLGDFDIDKVTLAAVLNSRQSKTPVGNDPWVKNTLAAVGDIAEQGLVLLTSLGMLTWELVAWACGMQNCCQVIVSPDR